VCVLSGLAWWFGWGLFCHLGVGVVYVLYFLHCFWVFCCSNMYMVVDYCLCINIGVMRCGMGPCVASLPRVPGTA